MSGQGLAFQTFADEMAEHVLMIAELVGVKVELFYCLQQVAGPDREEGIAYLLRSGENDAYLATDASGRVWYCDSARQIAHEVTTDTDFLALSEDMLGVLGCQAIGSDTSAHH